MGLMRTIYLEIRDILHKEGVIRVWLRSPLVVPVGENVAMT